MMKNNAWSILLLLSSFILAGCSVEIQQTPFLTPTTQPATSTPPIPPTTALETATSVVSLPTQIPRTWDTSLTGRLVYVFAEIVNDSIHSGVRVLDLSDGIVRTIFTAPSRGFVYDVAVSPDSKQVVISYLPPPDSAGVADRAIYRMPIDGSHPPQPLIQSAAGDENYQAEWSPDGKYIYYTSFNLDATPQANTMFPLYTIYRIAYPGGAPEKIAENSLWPSISPDSSQIVYVKYTGSDLQNELYVADTDGGNPRQVVLAGSWGPNIKDAPIFLPDGQSILFSAPFAPQAYKPNWLDKLMGVRVAQAHNVPSDWYVVPVRGGEPTRLTRIQSLGLFASISPDKKHIASLSGNGIFVMDLDGSAIFQLSSAVAAQGAIRWIP